MQPAILSTTYLVEPNHQGCPDTSCSCKDLRRGTTKCRSPGAGPAMDELGTAATQKLPNPARINPSMQADRYLKLSIRGSNAIWSQAMPRQRTDASVIRAQTVWVLRIRPNSKYVLVLHFCSGIVKHIIVYRFLNTVLYDAKRTQRGERLQGQSSHLRWKPMTDDMQAHVEYTHALGGADLSAFIPSISRLQQSILK